MHDQNFLQDYWDQSKFQAAGQYLSCPNLWTPRMDNTVLSIKIVVDTRLKTCWIPFKNCSLQFLNASRTQPIACWTVTNITENRDGKKSTTLLNICQMKPKIHYFPTTNFSNYFVKFIELPKSKIPTLNCILIDPCVISIIVIIFTPPTTAPRVWIALMIRNFFRVLLYVDHISSITIKCTMISITMHYA